MAGVEEVHILWTSEGMSCDGDTVPVTAAMQPSLEDGVPGLIPGLPRVHLHNKVPACSPGGEQADFMEPFFQAARGELVTTNLVDTPYGKASGNSVKMTLPKSAQFPATEFEWKVLQWANTIERDRAHLLHRLCGGALGVLSGKSDGADAQGQRQGL